MKSQKEIIGTLNALLADELTAISQYIVHSEMCKNWGFEKLHTAVEKRAITEMDHAEQLIGRILFLEGVPIVSNLNPMHIGSSVLEQFRNDLDAELGALQSYNEAIKLVTELGDGATRLLLEGILKDEDDHADWLETQLETIEQIGIQNYLAQQAV